MISREEGHINKDIVRLKDPRRGNSKNQLRERETNRQPSVKRSHRKFKTYINHIVESL